MVSREQKHILIIGSGSVGKRHARNLVAQGCTVSCVDPRKDRLDEVVKDIKVQGIYDSFVEGLSKAKRLHGVVVASPPRYHIDQSIASLEKGLPVFLEKPVSPEADSAIRLQECVHSTGIPLLLGYTWRWWEPLRQVRHLLASKEIGNLLHVRFVMSAHLEDWHPWENVQDFFMASKELGGGALLDESHWLDLMIWFFGMPDSVFGRINKISSLDIETDDNVDMLVKYSEGPLVSIHLDLYGRPHEKKIIFVGEKGTIRWTADPNQVAVGHNMLQQWEITDYDCERNDMFNAAASEFLEILSGDRVRTCNINDGVRVMKLIEAVRRSDKEQCIVQLSGVK